MDCYLILISVGSLASLLLMILLGIIRLIVGDLYHVHVYCCHIINYFTLHIICFLLKIFEKYLVCIIKYFYGSYTTKTFRNLSLLLIICTIVFELILLFFNYNHRVFRIKRIWRLQLEKISSRT